MESLESLGPRVALDPPCGECHSCDISQIDRSTVEHPAFRLIFKNPTDGVNFSCSRHTALQITDVFTRDLIPGYMDWDIKRDALNRWNEMIAELLGESWEDSLWRTEEFDLWRAFYILDDFLFMRTLRDNVGIQWVDSIPNRELIGQCRENWDIRGWLAWIVVVRPSPAVPRSVQECLETLLHEMCHALFNLACNCVVCSCRLNRMNSDGLTGHGPCWCRVKAVVEATANRYLRDALPGIFTLEGCEVQSERTARLKMLKGLSAKIERQNDPAERLKKMQRKNLYRRRELNTPEGDSARQEEDALFSAVVETFRRAESAVCHAQTAPQSVQRGR